MNKLDRFLKKLNESLPESNFSDIPIVHYMFNILVLFFLGFAGFALGTLSLICAPIYSALSLINMIIKYDYEMKSKDTLKNILPNWAKELHNSVPYYKLYTNKVLTNKNH